MGAHLEVEAVEAEGAEALARAAREAHVQAAPPAAVTVLLGDGARDARARRAVRVDDGRLHHLVLVPVDGGDHLVRGGRGRGRGRDRGRMYGGV